MRKEKEDEEKNLDSQMPNFTTQKKKKRDCLKIQSQLTGMTLQ